MIRYLEEDNLDDRDNYTQHNEFQPGGKGEYWDNNLPTHNVELAQKTPFESLTRPQLVELLELLWCTDDKHDGKTKLVEVPDEIMGDDLSADPQK